jgi:hypothetical protein
MMKSNRFELDPSFSLFHLHVTCISPLLLTAKPIIPYPPTNTLFHTEQTIPSLYNPTYPIRHSIAENRPLHPVPAEYLPYETNTRHNNTGAIHEKRNPILFEHTFFLEEYPESISAQLAAASLSSVLSGLPKHIWYDIYPRAMQYQDPFQAALFITKIAEHERSRQLSCDGSDRPLQLTTSHLKGEQEYIREFGGRPAGKQLFSQVVMSSLGIAAQERELELLDDELSENENYKPYFYECETRFRKNIRRYRTQISFSWQTAVRDHDGTSKCAKTNALFSGYFGLAERFRERRTQEESAQDT